MKITRRQLSGLISQTLNEVLGIHSDTPSGRKAARMDSRLRSPEIVSKMYTKLAGLEVDEPEQAQDLATLLGSEEELLPQKWEISLDDWVNLSDSVIKNLYGFTRIGDLTYMTPDNDYEDYGDILRFQSRVLGKPIEDLMFISSDAGSHRETYKSLVKQLTQGPPITTVVRLFYPQWFSLLVDVNGKKFMLMNKWGSGSITI